MKKIILTFALTIGMFVAASANTVATETTTSLSQNQAKVELTNQFQFLKDVNITVEKATDKDAKTAAMFAFTFYDSCGGVWEVSGYGFSMGEIFDILMGFDSFICD
jgi:hypothetical protein